MDMSSGTLLITPIDRSTLIDLLWSEIGYLIGSNAKLIQLCLVDNTLYVYRWLKLLPVKPCVSLELLDRQILLAEIQGLIGP